MEYIDGGTLADRIADADGGFPIHEALWIGECLCRGIAVAHSLGIAYLDVKPANVLFRSTPDGVWDLPKVADWGLALVLADQTGTVEGLSPSYAAPEQFDAGEFGRPDTLTDVYQVGAVLYELLTGTPLAPESRFQAMQVAMSSDPVTPPSAERPALDPTVDAAVLAALEREKTDRYSAIQVVANTLHALRVGGDLPPIVTQRLDGSDGGRAREAGVSSSRSPNTDPGNDQDKGTGISETEPDSDIVNRVVDYDNPGSYSASPGDHEGISNGETEPMTDRDHSEEASQDDHTTELSRWRIVSLPTKVPAHTRRQVATTVVFLARRATSMTGVLYTQTRRQSPAALLSVAVWHELERRHQQTEPEATFRSSGPTRPRTPSGSHQRLRMGSFSLGLTTTHSEH